MNTPANRRLVVAGSYGDYKKYVDHEADPRLLHTYADGPSRFAGRVFTDENLIFLPGWTEHPKAKEIIAQVDLRRALNGAKR